MLLSHAIDSRLAIRKYIMSTLLTNHASYRCHTSLIPRPVTWEQGQSNTAPTHLACRSRASFSVTSFFKLVLLWPVIIFLLPTSTKALSPRSWRRPLILQQLKIMKICILSQLIDIMLLTIPSFCLEVSL